MNYLYQYVPPNKPDGNSAFVGTLLSGNNIYLLPKEDSNATLVGKWDNDGSLHVVDEPTYAELRPLGNDSGEATSMLDLMGYQGHAQRKLQQSPVEHTYPEYPASEQPFTLRITRTQTLDDAWPHIPWGWTVEVLSDDPERDITARAIGVYDENWNYLYTTGAFVLMKFEEGEDEEGNPITVEHYGTECPVGQRKATAEPVYFALLLGAAQEGRWVLEGATDTRQFWSDDQALTPNNTWSNSDIVKWLEGRGVTVPPAVADIQADLLYMVHEEALLSKGITDE